MDNKHRLKKFIKLHLLSFIKAITRSSSDLPRAQSRFQRTYRKCKKQGMDVLKIIDKIMDKVSEKITLNPEASMMIFRATVDAVYEGRGEDEDEDEEEDPYANAGEDDVIVLDESAVEDVIKNSTGKGKVWLDSTKRVVYEPMLLRGDMHVPPAIKLKLQPHQLEAVQFSFGCVYEDKGCVISHELGLGKTVTAMCLAQSLKQYYERHCRCLVVAPNMCHWTWFNELLKFKEMDLLDMDMYKLETNASLGAWRKFGGLLLVTESKLRNVFASAEGDCDFNVNEVELVILDEAHIMGKNPDTQIYKAVNAIPCKRRVALTGRPIANNVMEYYHLIKLVNPAHFEDLGIPDKHEFHNLYGSLDWYGSKKDPKTVLRDKIKLLAMQKDMQRVLHRRVKSDSVDLPKTRQYLVGYDIPAEAQCLIDESKSPIEVNNTFHAVAEKYKVERVGALVKHLLSNTSESILVYSQRNDALEKLHAFLGLTRRDFINCNEKTGDREASLNAFMAFKTRILFCGVQCASHGLTLTAASRVILMDVNFNPNYEDQAIGRAVRMGQEKEVIVYIFVARGIQTYMLLHGVRKRALFNQLFDDAKVTSTGSELLDENERRACLQMWRTVDGMPMEIDPNDPTLDPALRCMTDVCCYNREHLLCEDSVKLSESEKRMACNAANKLRNESGRTSENMKLSCRDFFFGRDLLPTQWKFAHGIFVPFIPLFECINDDKVTLLLGPAPPQNCDAVVTYHLQVIEVDNETDAHMQSWDKEYHRSSKDPIFHTKDLQNLIEVKVNTKNISQSMVVKLRITAPGHVNGHVNERLVSAWSPLSSKYEKLPGDKGTKGEPVKQGPVKGPGMTCKKSFVEEESEDDMQKESGEKGSEDDMQEELVEEESEDDMQEESGEEGSEDDMQEELVE